MTAGMLCPSLADSSAWGCKHLLLIQYYWNIFVVTLHLFNGIFQRQTHLWADQTNCKFCTAHLCPLLRNTCLCPQKHVWFQLPRKTLTAFSVTVSVKVIGSPPGIFCHIKTNKLFPSKWVAGSNKFLPDAEVWILLLYLLNALSLWIARNYAGDSLIAGNFFDMALCSNFLQSTKALPEHSTCCVVILTKQVPVKATKVCFKPAPLKSLPCGRLD